MKPAPTAPVSPETPSLPSLKTRRWSLHGAALGVATTVGVSAGAATAAVEHVGLLGGLLVAAALSGPAAVLGAAFGRRWKRRVERDAHRVTVARWLTRLATEGAVFASASAVGSLALFQAAGIGRGDLADVVKAAGLVALVAAPAGAATLTTVGLPFLVSLARGRRPWGPLALAALAAPPFLATAIAGAAYLTRFFG